MSEKATAKFLRIKEKKEESLQKMLKDYKREIS